MGSIDASLSLFLWESFYLWVLIFIVFITLFNKKFHCFRKRFCCPIKYLSVKGTRANGMYEIKKHLFRVLHNLKSKDWKLRNVGVIRILEVAPGTGDNLNFYPNNSYIIVVEPNLHNRALFAENLTHSVLLLEHFIQGEPKDISKVEGGCVDAVISTNALCMVRDVKSVLNEIRRVLAVDGIFLYIEHVHHERSWKRLAQNIVNPIWGIVFDGCNLTRDTSALVLEAGFSNVSQNKLYKPFGTFMGIFGHPTLVGIAIK